MVIAVAEETFDVVVTGGGGAGLAAAIEARTAGCTVVLFEKSASLGGSTAWSVGSVTASATPYQMRKGINDRPEDHWREMAGFNGDLDGRRSEACHQNWRAYRQRRSRARPRVALHPATESEHPAQPAAVARACQSHGVVARSFAERAAAPFCDEFRDDCARAIAQPIRRGRDSGE